MALQELALSGYMEAVLRPGRLGVRPQIKKKVYTNLDGSYTIDPTRISWLFKYGAVVEIAQPKYLPRLYLTQTGMDIIVHLIKQHQLPIIKRILHAHIAEETP